MTREELLERKRQLQAKLVDVDRELAQDTAQVPPAPEQQKTIRRSDWEKMTGKEYTAFRKAGGKIVDD